jgi:hypothetical protein
MNHPCLAYSMPERRHAVLGWRTIACYQARPAKWGPPHQGQGRRRRGRPSNADSALRLSVCCGSGPGNEIQGCGISAALSLIPLGVQRAPLAGFERHSGCYPRSVDRDRNVAKWGPKSGSPNQWWGASTGGHDQMDTYWGERAGVTPIPAHRRAARAIHGINLPTPRHASRFWIHQC